MAKKLNLSRAELNHKIMCLLRERHKEDISTAELEAGRTGRRMDFVAIKCSWTQPQIVAYEVKVDRQDFVNDKKWPSYLDTCKELIFVTAPGVATLEEIPEECGWHELSSNGARLFTRKKAPVRVIKAQDEAVLYKRFLMRDRGGLAQEPNQDFWNRWLAKNREDRALGRVLRREIALTAAAQIAKSNEEVRAMRKRVENMEHAMKVFERLGLDPEQIARCGSYDLERTIRRRLEIEQSGLVLESLEAAHLNLRSACTNIEHKIEQAKRTISNEIEKQKNGEQS